MIIVMQKRAAEEQVNRVFERIKALGYKPHPIYGVERTVIGAIGDERGKVRLQSLESMPGVEKVVPILQPFKLAGRELKKDPTIIEVEDVRIGGDRFVVIAGPCSVENREQILQTAAAVKKAGAKLLRGGAFKPRTSPYSFQGLQEEGLHLLAQAREETGLPVVTEVLAPEDVPLVAQYADILQIGARNMMNFVLLKRVGHIDKPVLLKRGMMATVKELLMSAEYIISEGNQQVILCERGIRTFEEYTRNTLDLSAVPMLKQLSHLPVIVDPSHGCGVRSLVAPMAKAAVAAGADGLMIEVHPHPQDAYSDGPQSLPPDEFERLMHQLKGYVTLEGRHL
ncbi:MAG: 3-deoxy-7-phosphoheptulonate synthase [Candidatus Latescibacteria bacterium 4484_181]|nr:MAG: 3-deoxy-7-phosphoheptulonate synthase [Candidatus Latescibacteria bacterium 4484_181]RKY68688.1 MAG: 3-deoxy-7-phosphoheptulonate synthase [Candidatus Latescibacterota bacterium]RKY73659.1 MAG: 3-deoxy-7-phosphoheptulonate synthase [Candidatus Latescibacterota bacterium]HDN67708.1 3-deoxy-7-phosphoheptulonate synthase [Bacillota bacterium]